MTRCYLDTSVTVHALSGDRAAMEWFDASAARNELISSRLPQTEFTRMFLTAAEALSQHVKTVDAIHLATALRLGCTTHPG